MTNDILNNETLNNETLTPEQARWLEQTQDLTPQDLTLELTLNALEGTLTEIRYNEILDILLPDVADCPDAAALLKGFGEPEWKQRRALRSRTQSTASAA